jgi:hypothetical protein
MPYIVTILRGSTESASHVSVSLFDTYGDAESLCALVNQAKLNDGEWVNANVRKMNTIYPIRKPAPMALEDFKKLDDRMIQRIMREIDVQDLTIILHKKDDEFAQKIFRNMPKRAVQMLKEDVEFMGYVPEEKIQSKLNKILFLANTINSDESDNNTEKMNIEKHFKKFAKTPKDYYSYSYGPKEGVLVMHGRNEIVEGISVSYFYNNGIHFVNFINSLKLKDGYWVHARCLEENQEYEIKKQASPVLAKFDQLLNLRDLVIEITFQEFDNYNIAIALKFASDDIKEKIFGNMPAEKVAELKYIAKKIEEASNIDMSYVKQVQRKILKKAMKINSDNRCEEPEILKD